MRFFLVFPRLFLSFSPEQPVREEKVKGDAVSQAVARPSSALFIPTCFFPATFILFKVEDEAGNGRGREGN